MKLQLTLHQINHHSMTTGLWLLSARPHSVGSYLTQQDEDAGQDGDERSSAEARGQTVRLGVARHDVPLLVAAAHADGQRAGAGLDRLLAVSDDDWEVEDGLVLLRPATATGQDPRCVVWKETMRSERG